MSSTPSKIGAAQLRERRRRSHRCDTGRRPSSAPSTSSRRAAARARRADCAGSATTRPARRASPRVTAAHATRSPRNFGKMMPSLTAPTLVAGAADALQAARDRRRRFDLDRPDRSRPCRCRARATTWRRARASCPAFSRSSISVALRARERSVMRAHQRLAGELVQRAGQPFREPAAVDEEQRRSMRADQLEQPRMDRAPDRLRHRPCARPGPLGCSTGLPIAAMSSTGVCTLIDQLLRRARIDDRDGPVA